MNRVPLQLSALLLVLCAPACETRRGFEDFEPELASRRSDGTTSGVPIEEPGWVTLPSGVRISDRVLGAGREAERGSVVRVHYTGKRPDGTVFDQTDRQKAPARFILNTGPGGVIPGFVDGISGMKEGGVRLMAIPWQLAYGEEGRGRSIPPRCDLSFEVELVEVP